MDVERMRKLEARQRSVAADLIRHQDGYGGRWIREEIRVRMTRMTIICEYLRMERRPSRYGIVSPIYGNCDPVSPSVTESLSCYCHGLRLLMRILEVVVAESSSSAFQERSGIPPRIARLAEVIKWPEEYVAVVAISAEIRNVVESTVQRVRAKLLHCSVVVGLFPQIPSNIRVVAQACNVPPRVCDQQVLGCR